MGFGLYAPIRAFTRGKNQVELSSLYYFPCSFLSFPTTFLHTPPVGSPKVNKAIVLKSAPTAMSGNLSSRRAKMVIDPAEPTSNNAAEQMVLDEEGSEDYPPS